MQVYFDHRRRGVLFTRDEVVVSVNFTDLELAVIREYRLHDLVVLMCKTASPQEPIFIRDLLHHALVQPVASPVHAQSFENEMREALEGLKAYLMGSIEPPSPREYTI